MISLKKLVTLASCLVLTASFYAGLSIKKIEAYQYSPIGANTDATRNRELLWVYNATANGHDVGDVVVWTDGSVADGLEIDQTTTANNGLVAGVIAVSSVSATSWGWLQTHGYHSAVRIAVANSAGDSLVTSGTAEAATVYTMAQATGTAANEGRTFGVLGVALEATTTSTTVKALLYR